MCWKTTNRVSAKTKTNAEEAEDAEDAEGFINTYNSVSKQEENIVVEITYSVPIIPLVFLGACIYVLFLLVKALKKHLSP